MTAMSANTDHPPRRHGREPVTSERFTFTHTARSTGGAVRMPHEHPIQTERVAA
jgi:hypothetical protein